MKRRIAALVALGGFLILKPEPSLAIDAGVARVDVTPSEPIRLTGYGGRKTNNVGVEQKLWAKALALGSDREGPALLLTLDNCGIAESTYRELVSRLTRKSRLKQAGIAIACSHTHSGPCTTDWAPNIFSSDISPPQQAVIDRYTTELIGKLEGVALAALKDRRPSQLSWSQGQAGFARNRRVVVGKTAQFGDNATGPVDQALPVLKITEPDGKLRAVVANYACHCTTLGGEFNHVCGDWAGYAQEAIERDNPGAVALVTIGCGADANPSPRGGPDGGLALAKRHGEELAAEAKRLLGLTFTPIDGKLSTRLKEIRLPFGPHFTRDQWQARATNSGIVGYHARKWLARLDRGEKPPDSLYYPISTWQFGDELALVFLPGEVVVDYVLRLKRELDPQRLWVSGYANYVPCYIPSRRILAEGGYEAEDSLWYYDRPARISTNAEELIIKTVHELVPKSFKSDPKKAEVPDPKTPQQALSTFRTKAGFTVELVASEPLIESPVAIDWDARGRLWVCEMYDYPTGIPERTEANRRSAGSFPLTPALSPREREKRGTDSLQPGASASSNRGGDVSLSPSEGERAGVRGKPQAAGKTQGIEGHVWGKNPPSAYTPGGRIKILTDTDGDGRYDKATLFLDKLAFPTGVFPWRNGALICAAPDILFAEDTDGDGRADVVRTNYTGFATHNYQARVNGFRWGLDGWLHGSSGLFGGKVKSLLTGKEVDLGGRDFRIRPDTGEIEPLAGISQMGRVRDDFDNWFGNDNSTLLWHYPLPDHYLRRNPYVTYPDPRVNVGADVRRLTSTRNAKPGTRNENQSLLTSAATAATDPNKLYPISRTLERFNHPESANRVTGACGPDIYRDNLLGAEYYGNAFICEPVHNLVTRLVLEPDGVTFAGRRAEEEQRSEFLASTDNWFRPVQVRTGPDGALWVVDMYRFVIEHPRWIAPERLKTLDVRAGADMGRIYRVYPKGAKLGPIRDLTKLNDQELAEALDTPNGTTRDAGDIELRQRRLREQPSLTAVLASVATKSTNAGARAQAARLLASQGWLSVPTAQQLFDDADPRLTSQELRCMEELALAGLPPRRNGGAEGVVLSEEPRRHLLVQFQSALTLGCIGGSNLYALAFVWHAAQEHPDDLWIRAAALASATNSPDLFLRGVLGSLKTNQAPGLMDLAQNLIATCVAINARPALAQAWQWAVSNSWSSGSIPEAKRERLAAAFLDAVERRKLTSREFFSGVSSGSASRALQADLERLTERAREQLRLEAAGTSTGSSSSLALLGRDPGHLDDDAKLLCASLRASHQSDRQQATLQRLRQMKSPTVAEALLHQWNHYPPAIRPAVAGLLIERADWAGKLLAGIETKVVASVELPLTTRQQLLRHADPEIREKAGRLLAVGGGSTREEILANYQSVASLRAVPDRGAALFDQNCAQCHAWRGHGHAVGPNLGEFAGKSAADFVQAIFDPNSAINPNFLAYNIETKDGRSLSGIVRGETASGLTLVQGGGVQETILRADIGEIRASNLSLMPEGLEQAMTPQDVADLIAWIKQAAPAPFGQASANPDLAAKNRAEFLKTGASGVAKVSTLTETLPYWSWIGTLPMAYCRQSAGVNRLAWEARPLTPALSPNRGEGVRPLTPALSPNGSEGARPLTPALSPSEGERENAAAAGKRIAVFRFPTAMGFLSQPSGKFSLRVNGTTLFDFNVALADESWQSPDGRARMSYTVTEANAEDSCGVLRIEVAPDLVKPGEPARFEVIASDSGSQRWFGIYELSAAHP